MHSFILSDHPESPLDFQPRCRYPLGAPRKIRQLIAELESAGFLNRGGKGSHRNFRHLATGVKVTMSGKPGDDAKLYQEKDLKRAIELSKQ